MKRALIVVAVVLGIGAILVSSRHRILVWGLSFAEPPPLLEAADEGPSLRWVDDYFAIAALDDRTFAIVEPRYAQQNISYLLVGDERAVLFDAGPGLRDIRAVAESLTDRPVTFVPSHLHYDHTGNTVVFDRVAVVDLPHLRARAADGRLRPTEMEHLGAAEGIAAPTLVVDEWLEPGSSIDLGGRRIQVLFTPGHTENSISLFDPETNQLFSGDFLYAAQLFAFVPGSSMGDYVEGAETVLSTIGAETEIYGAHRKGPPGVPVLDRSDVSDLRTTLLAIASGELAGEGTYPVEYPVNSTVSLLAEPRWLQSWERAPSGD